MAPGTLTYHSAGCCRREKPFFSSGFEEKAGKNTAMHQDNMEGSYPRPFSGSGTFHLWAEPCSFPRPAACTKDVLTYGGIIRGFCSISWVENLSQFGPPPPPFQTSRLNAHLGASSPNTSITAAFQQQTKHLEILLAESLPSPGWVKPRGLQELLGTAPPSPPEARPLTDSAPKQKLGVSDRSPLALRSPGLSPCRGASDRCVTHGSQRFALSSVLK